MNCTPKYKNMQKCILNWKIQDDKCIQVLSFKFYYFALYYYSCWSSFINSLSPSSAKRAFHNGEVRRRRASLVNDGLTRALHGFLELGMRNGIKMTRVGLYILLSLLLFILLLLFIFGLLWSPFAYRFASRNSRNPWLLR